MRYRISEEHKGFFVLDEYDLTTMKIGDEALGPFDTPQEAADNARHAYGVDFETMGFVVVRVHITGLKGVK